jgi:hypothetical protein
MEKIVAQSSRSPSPFELFYGQFFGEGIAAPIVFICQPIFLDC